MGDGYQISPDELVYFEWGWFNINATLVFTWVVMAVLVGGSWLITRRLARGEEIPRWQNLLEIIAHHTRNQIRDITHDDPDRFLPFIGSLFLLIAVSNVLSVVPFFIAPTASLSTTAALAICVFVAVPVYSIASIGPARYVKHYIEPTPLMLPFNIIGELSRTLALAVRLFGNVMSAARIVAILLAVIPLFFPVLMQLLGLLTGLIQAYIFAVLALVYIASGSRTQMPGSDAPQDKEPVNEAGRQHEE